MVGCVLREFVFKTSSASNPLCRFTKEDPARWILIHLFRTAPRKTSDRALFIIHATPADADAFLNDQFGRRYGTFERLHQDDRTTSVEVSNYAMPAYRGADPVEMAIRMLGPEVFFEPVLVHDGYIHVRALALDRAGQPFPEMVRRLSAATGPSDFRLIHQGPWDPLRRLLPQDTTLSERQHETLRMAIDLGYYDTPRRCTLATLAEAFGVSKAAVHKHLQTAEAKLVRAHAP
jgi:predicted DNA binding protein